MNGKELSFESKERRVSRVARSDPSIGSQVYRTSLLERLQALPACISTRRPIIAAGGLCYEAASEHTREHSELVALLQRKNLNLSLHEELYNFPRPSLYHQNSS